MKQSLTLIALASLLACGTAHAESTQTQTTKELANQLKQLQTQLQLLRAELDTLKQTKAADATTAAPQTSPAPALAPQHTTEVANTTPMASAVTAAAESPISFFGYGEMNFTRPKNDPASSSATLRRGVMGIGYRFTDHLRFISELEVENAVVSSTDTGEIELEQFYIENDFNDKVSAKLGLFLMPFGYLNESHEPTRYYGVQRNLIETAIIPSTWREMGIGVRGTTDEGWRWDTGVVTSFDLSKWPSASSADTLSSPLATLHQEGQNAKAASLATYGALNYNGIPGLNMGGALYQGGIGQQQSAATSNASLTLSEIHARWQGGAWDISSVAALGRFNHVADFNATTASANPVPDTFHGWYVQSAYRLWSSGDYSLVPFTRYERLNTAVGFPGVPQGVVIANDQPDVRVWTMGANFYLHPQVVLKADFQRFVSDSSQDRFNLGIGFHY
jgi:hypothetical protein